MYTGPLTLASKSDPYRLSSMTSDLKATGKNSEKSTLKYFIFYTVDLVTSWLLKKTENRVEFCESCVWLYF